MQKAERVNEEGCGTANSQCSLLMTSSSKAPPPKESLTFPLSVPSRGQHGQMPEIMGNAGDTVLQLRWKDTLAVRRQGIPKSHHTTSLMQAIYWGRKIQDCGDLCFGEKQQRMDQKNRDYTAFLGGVMGQSFPG